MEEETKDSTAFRRIRTGKAPRTARNFVTVEDGALQEEGIIEIPKRASRKPSTSSTKTEPRGRCCRASARVGPPAVSRKTLRQRRNEQIKLKLLAEPAKPPSRQRAGYLGDPDIDFEKVEFGGGVDRNSSSR
jgi:hypothetical protein